MKHDHFDRLITNTQKVETQKLNRNVCAQPNVDATGGRGRSSGARKRKRIFCAISYFKNDHFTKTGSGQT
jgi:hypothetical protein